MSNSSYQVFSNNDTNQTSKDVKLINNMDGSYSLSTLNIPQGIAPSTKAVIHTVSEKLVNLNTLTPLISIRNDDTDRNIRYGTLSIATDGSKPVVFYIYRNGILTGATFVSHGVDNFSSHDVSATSIDITGLEPIGGLVMNKLDTVRINLFTNDIFIKGFPGDTLTLCALSTSNTYITLFQRHLEEN